MQSIEAMVSFLFFVTIASGILLQLENQRDIDDSVYRVQLAEDAWRVLYLRGDFRDFSDAKRAALEQELAAIGDETGLCFFMDGVRFTNCRDSEPHATAVSLRKTVFYDGKPQNFTFSIGR